MVPKLCINDRALFNWISPFGDHHPSSNHCVVIDGGLFWTNSLLLMNYISYLEQLQVCLVFSQKFYTPSHQRESCCLELLRPSLDAKFKISKLSHRMCAAHAWSIKSRRNKKLIAQFACKLRDGYNESS